MNSTETELESYRLGRYILAAYTEGRLVDAAVTTFVVNLIAGAGITITLPSLFIPFAGVAFAAYRAVMWGVLFPPTQSTSILPHYVTLVIEGEAYILAAAAGWEQSQDLLAIRKDRYKSEARSKETKRPKKSSLWSAYARNIQ